MATKTRSTILSRDAILGAKLAQETVDVPEWGGSVIVRCLTGAERDAYDAWRFRRAIDTEHSLDKINNMNVRAQLASMTMIDEEGARLFSAADVEELGKRDGAALDRVYNVAQRLSKLVATEADLDALVERLRARPSGSPGSI